MKILSVALIGLLAMSTVAFAQETNNEVKPQKPEIKKEVQRGPRGPMMHQGDFGGQRGPMMRGQGPMGPRFQGPPMERGPRGPMFRGGDRQGKGCCDCRCHQQGKKFQKRHQFRGGR